MEDHPSTPLVVMLEDNPGDVLLLEMALRGLDQRVLLRSTSHAGRARAHLEAAREAEAGVLLLDVHLPDADGTEVLEELRSDQRFRDLPVVVWTSSREPRLRERAEELGAAAFFTKPEDLPGYRVVAEALLAALERSRF